ncbi:UNVERIFIED_CONTAM: hypothetical protein H355_016185 [Colinus virginianus]|nr:hypothetical protein H355_016185 [Colinus virginianus]
MLVFYDRYKQKATGNATVTVIYDNSTVKSTFSSPSPGSLVQAALTQPASVSANLGETVEITCTGGSSIYGSSWFQPKSPGSAPVTLIYANTNRPSNIPARFSGSTSGSTNTLTISGVQAEDEAIYHCGSYDSSSTAGSEIGHCEIEDSVPRNSKKIPCSRGSYCYGWYQLMTPASVMNNNTERTFMNLWFHIPLHTGNITGVQAMNKPVYYCADRDIRCSLVQAALTQPASMSANPGETVKITCTGSSYSYGWYQQKSPGSAPVTLIYANTNRPSNIPERFSGPRTAPSVDWEVFALLRITVWYIRVRDRPDRPSPVTVEWLVDGSTRNGETTAPQRQSNNQYMASSYLSLTSSEWLSHETYTCRVSHEVNTVEKTLKRSECS